MCCCNEGKMAPVGADVLMGIDRSRRQNTIMNSIASKCNIGDSAAYAIPLPRLGFTAMGDVANDALRGLRDHEPDM